MYHLGFLMSNSRHRRLTKILLQILKMIKERLSNGEQILHLLFLKVTVS